MPTATFRYCPVCATPLAEKMVSGMLRPFCPACGFILFADPKVVTVILLYHQNKLLLGKRAINPGMGLWSFFGGYVEQGEQVEESALREIKEETNLDVQLEGFIGVYSTRGKPHILLAYHANIEAEQLKNLRSQPEEISELAFFTLHELPPFAFPIDEEILTDWQKLSRNHKVDKL